MKSWLVDTGPLVALLCADDSHHAWAVEQSKHAPSTVVTCDAVISESLFLLNRAGHRSDDFFELQDSGWLRSDFHCQAEYRTVRDLMRRYRDRPMSFADACLVRMAELTPDSSVWTLDQDFQVYKKNRRQSISVVGPW